MSQTPEIGALIAISCGYQSNLVIKEGTGLDKFRFTRDRVLNLFG